jgi:hypothetical protein
MTPEITLSLSLEQVNAILTALGQLPYVQSADLINEIKNQANSQLHPAPGHE